MSDGISDAIEEQAPAPDDAVICRECGAAKRIINNDHLQGKRHQSHEKADVIDTDEYRERYPEAPLASPQFQVEATGHAIDDTTMERRRDLIRRIWRGEDRADVVDDLAERYDVTEETVRRDWRERSKWVQRAFGLDDIISMVFEEIAEKRDIREEYREIANDLRNEGRPEHALSAIREADRNISDTLEQMRELGILPESPTKIQHEVSGSVEEDELDGAAADVYDLGDADE